MSIFVTYAQSLQASVINGLSDHDAQLLLMKDINLEMQNYRSKTIRNINQYTMAEFKLKVSYESWENIFGEDDNKDVDMLFNTFLNTYLRIFYPLKTYEREQKMNHV
jgi:uncharacterized secreted protein with C-terminal beta-propeller domain